MQLNLKCFRSFRLLDLTGVMAAFTAVLKDAKIPVFAISTW
jgi:hypothetical protein